MSLFVGVVSAVLALGGCAFITAGTLGLLRFGDVRSRLHALAKADTLGLGLIVLALLPHAGSAAAAAKLLLIRGVALASAAVIAYLLANGVDDGAARPYEGRAGDTSEPGDTSERGDTSGVRDASGGRDASESGDPSGVDVRREDP